MNDPTDIFAGFREPEENPKGRSTAGAVEAEDDRDDDAEPYELIALRPEKYEAFRLGKRRGERLIIYRAARPMRFPAYHELRDIAFEQAFQQGFTLFFQALTVEVEGRNLWPVIHAISNGRCAAIYEYHKKLYPAPAGKDQPMIESIKLLPPVALADDEPED